MKSKNLKLATEFYEYCKANPDLRFWQALLNWSKFSFIFVSKSQACKMNWSISQDLTDTYYFEGKDK